MKLERILLENFSDIIDDALYNQIKNNQVSDRLLIKLAMNILTVCPHNTLHELNTANNLDVVLNNYCNRLKISFQGFNNGLKYKPNHISYEDFILVLLISQALLNIFKQYKEK